MLYLLWGLLNICAIVAFVYVCYKAIVLVRQRFGLLAALVFIVVLTSFINKHDDEESKQNNSVNPNVRQFIPDEEVKGYNTYSQQVDLDKSWLATYRLYIRYAKDPQGNRLIVSAFTGLNGASSGTYWQPTDIIVTKITNEQVQYVVNYRETWSLAGFPIFVKSLPYEGTMKLKW